MRLRRPGFACIGVIVVAAAAFAVAAGRGKLPLSASVAHPSASLLLSLGENPYPVRLVRPAAAPLSAMAQLGRLIFFDPALSSSGRLACASCHSPQHAYGPPNAAPAMAGGPSLSRQGVRAVPSLMYLERPPNFCIGPDDQENEAVSLAQLAAFGRDAARAQKTARDTAASGSPHQQALFDRRAGEFRKHLHRGPRGRPSLYRMPPDAIGA